MQRLMNEYLIAVICFVIALLFSISAYQFSQDHWSVLLERINWKAGGNLTPIVSDDEKIFLEVLLPIASSVIVIFIYVLYISSNAISSAM